MFSKDEEKAIRSAFWGTLTTKAQKHRSSAGKRINWFKYPTGLNDIYIRTEVDKNGCRVCIDLQFKDPGIRELFYEQFLETKTVFENTMISPINWKPNYEHGYGTEVSRISVENTTTNLYRQEDWPEMHTFIVTHLRRLDVYWEDFGELFKTLK
jgi:hypothetical protein